MRMLKTSIVVNSLIIMSLLGLNACEKRDPLQQARIDSRWELRQCIEKSDGSAGAIEACGDIYRK